MEDSSPTEETGGEQTEHNGSGLSRRQTLGVIGAAGFGGLAAFSPVTRADHNSEDEVASTGEVSVIPNPNFITNARGEAPPFDDDTLLFDPGPVSIPLDEIMADDTEYDAMLFRSLNDSKRQVVRPPAGYSRENGYEQPWEPVTWGEYSAVTGDVALGEAFPDAGTRVTVTVENGIPNGRYTVWVVKFAALSSSSSLGPGDPFVTPDGNGLVGFHNLGQKFGERGDTENTFTLNEDSYGTLQAMNEGATLTGIPGFREPGYPFVGEPGDYEQDEERLVRVANDVREEDEIHFVGAYHYDDHTWGVYPGPWHVNHFDTRFQF
jgi:hypothetical protein